MTLKKLQSRNGKEKKIVRQAIAFLTFLSPGPQKHVLGVKLFILCESRPGVFRKQLGCFA
jgi:hypothetical protein